MVNVELGHVIDNKVIQDVTSMGLQRKNLSCI